MCVFRDIHTLEKGWKCIDQPDSGCLWRMGFRVRCGEMVSRDTQFLLYVLLCLIGFFFLQVHVILVLKIILKDKNEINFLVNIFITTDDHETKIKIR